MGPLLRTSGATIPEPPEDPLPPALTYPRMDQAMPGFDSITSFGAIANDAGDDLSALQAALNNACTTRRRAHVYIPAGLFRVSGPAYLNHPNAPTCDGEYTSGGRIAGAGSSYTTIEMASGTKESVFLTQGLALAVIQGLTVKTWTYASGDPTKPALGFEATLLATGWIGLHDVYVEGGFIGIAAGTHGATIGQCSTIVLVRGRVSGSYYGFSAGHFNAIADGILESVLVDNAIGIGAWTDGAQTSGGEFGVFASSILNPSVSAIQQTNSAGGSAYYFHGLRTDAATVQPAIASTSAPHVQVYDESAFFPPAGSSPLWSWDGAAGGVMLLHSRATRATMALSEGLGEPFGISLWSTHASEWETDVSASGRAQRDEVSQAGSCQ